MTRSLLKAVAWAGLLSVGAASAAYAGGFSRGTADTDILFEPENFNMRAGATLVAPTQNFSVNPVPALVGTDYYGTYVIPSAAVKFNATDNLRCAGTYTQNVGADVQYAAPRFPSGKLTEEFTTDEFGLSCAVRFQAGPGVVSVIGGGFVEYLDYDRVTFLAPGATADLALKGEEYGWRAGLAYEIPEYALRAQIMYRSGTDYGATGTLTVPGALVGQPLVPSVALPATGIGSLPQIVELKAQTGVAPGWLVYGSVRWTDWTVLQNLTVVTPIATVVDEYQWRDGWTITGGVAHSFNDMFAAAVNLTWDRGVSTGWDLRDEVWTLGIGGSAKDKIGGEFRGGIGFSYLAPGKETNYAPGLNQETDSGYAIIVNASYTLHW